MNRADREENGRFIQKKGCFVDKVQVRAFPVRKAQGLQVRAVIHTGVPPQTLALREAIAQKPALLSLRDRLMAEEVPGQGVAKWGRKGRRSRI